VGRLRTGVTVAAVLLVTAGTQVIPAVPVPPVTVAAAALPGMPFDIRIQANLERVADAVASSAPERAGVFREILDQGRQMLFFDPEANNGRGAWAELVGTIDEHTEVVGVLVPGSAAFIVDDNFDKYHQRAARFVEESGGTLAMVVWAAGAFPKGWLQGTMTRNEAPLGRSLAVVTHELRTEIRRRLGPHAQVRVVVASHSFGGAVVGTAERYGLDADAVLHVASAGVGDVRDPYDYPDPTRPRYSMPRRAT
jgi:hypothetical protein